MKIYVDRIFGGKIVLMTGIIAQLWTIFLKPFINFAIGTFALQWTRYGDTNIVAIDADGLRANHTFTV